MGFCGAYDVERNEKIVRPKRVQIRGARTVRERPSVFDEAKNAATTRPVHVVRIDIWETCGKKTIRRVSRTTEIPLCAKKPDTRFQIVFLLFCQQLV